MVDRALLSQLQSMNTSQRKDAIMALGRAKDREAIPHLLRVAENDPDNDLRELARKASLYIEKHAPNVKPFKMPWDDEDAGGESAQEEPADDVSAARYIADMLPEYEQPTEQDIAEKQDKEWAERFIDRAWQSYYTGDKQGAESFMRKAFERSPKIAESEAAREAAGKIMGMNPDRAVNALLKPKSMRRNGKPDSLSRKPNTQPAKPEKTVDEIEDGTVGTLAFDLFIFFLISFVLYFIGLYAANSLVLDQIMGATSDDPNGEVLKNYINDVLQGGTLSIILTSAANALYTLLQSVTTWFMIHIVATTLIGGNSTYPRLVRKTYLYFALFTPVTALLMVFGIAMAVILGDAGVMLSMLAITLLGGAFIISWRIGVAYRFDPARGCFTLIMTGLAFLCCGLTIMVALMAADIGPFAGLMDQINQAR